MKTTTKKLISIALAAVLFTAALAGCAAPAEPTPDFVYIPSYATLPKEVTEMSYTTYLDGVFYFIMSRPYDKEGNPLTEEEVKQMDEEYSRTFDEMISSSFEPESIPYDPGFTYRPEMYTMNENGTGLKKLAGYMPISVGAETSGLNSFAVDKSGKMWALETLYERMDDDYKETYFLRRLGTDGSEEFNIVLNDVLGQAEEYFYVYDVRCDGVGNAYLNTGGDGVAVFDTTGQMLFSVKADGWISTVVTMADGTMGAICGSREGNDVSLKVIDLHTRGWGASYDAPIDFYQAYAGSGDYDFCYNSSFSLMGYKSSTQQSEEILNWMGSDVNSDNISYVVIKDNGDVLAASSGWDDEKQESFTELITMTKTPYSQAEHKTELTLATMWLNYNIKSRVISFNKTNPDYRIIIKDYSQYNTDEDYSAGLTKLNTEIISGTIPDMIDVSQLPYEQYAAKGLLTDLYALMEGDSEVSREEFIPSILKTLESSEGKLYMLAPSFYVQSLIGRSDVVGEEMGWTMEEMQACLEAHPEADYPFGMYVGREVVLMYFCMMNMENYMNWETGECSFDSDEFKNMLTFAKSFPEKIEYSEENHVDTAELIADGRQIMEIYTSSDFQNIQFYEAQFGGDITFKGVPTADRAGNLASFSGALAVTNSCKDKEGAWAFMRTLYLPEYQDKIYEYPVIQSSFDKKLKEAMDPKKNQGGGMAVEDFEVEFGALTQNEADKLVALVDSVRHTSVYNESLMNIITEEAAAFFSGEKDVNDVADIIQSRMTIYINEQR